MRAFLSVAAFLSLFLYMDIALGQGSQPQEIDPREGPVRVQPTTEQNVQSVPVNEETGTVNWSEYTNLPPGPGARFAFLSTLYTPDPAALASLPAQLLDTAWFPTIPFAYGFSPASGQSISTQGWWYLEDTSGNLARRDMDIISGGNRWFCSTWFLGGGNLLHFEEGWREGYFAEVSYLPDEWSGPGIDYFLRSVWFRGILSGQRMQDLLTACGAERIGRDVIRGGRDRLLIYQIKPNETDWQNGRASLLVWLTIGDWRLIRTRLHAAFGTEVTEYRYLSPDVQNDPQVYYSDWLTSEIYWSINNYLLTHEGPFWGEGTEAGPTNPFEAGMVPYEGTGEAEPADQAETGENSQG